MFDLNGALERFAGKLALENILAAAVTLLVCLIATKVLLKVTRRLLSRTKLEERIRDSSMVESRSVARFLFASAVQVETDKQGRFLIPQYLREYAGLDKEVTIIGASVRAEIWSKERWEAVCASLTNDQVVEAMVKRGF